jgi:hypothetical protein
MLLEVTTHLETSEVGMTHHLIQGPEIWCVNVNSYKHDNSVKLWGYIEQIQYCRNLC